MSKYNPLISQRRHSDDPIPCHHMDAQMNRHTIADVCLAVLIALSLLAVILDSLGALFI